MATDIVTCEYEGQYDRFLTAGERYDLEAEQDGVLGIWEDEDREADQEEATSSYLLSLLG